MGITNSYNALWDVECPDDIPSNDESKCSASALEVHHHLLQWHIDLQQFHGRTHQALGGGVLYHSLTLIFRLGVKVLVRPA